MILWIDAQLSPNLARWIQDTFGVVSYALRDLGLRDANDADIFHAARKAGATIVSKDGDFVSLLERFGPPPQILWITCGNTSNARLQKVLLENFPKAKTCLEHGEPLVEIGERDAFF